MEVYIDKIDKTERLKFEGTVNDLLKQLNINSETVIVARGSDLLTEDDEVNNDDNIKIMSVISGG